MPMLSRTVISRLVMMAGSIVSRGSNAKDWAFLVTAPNFLMVSKLAFSRNSARLFWNSMSLNTCRGIAAADVGKSHFKEPWHCMTALDVGEISKASKMTCSVRALFEGDQLETKFGRGREQLTLCHV